MPRVPTPGRVRRSGLSTLWPSIVSTGSWSERARFRLPCGCSTAKAHSRILLPPEQRHPSGRQGSAVTRSPGGLPLGIVVDQQVTQDPRGGPSGSRRRRYVDSDGGQVADVDGL